MSNKKQYGQFFTTDPKIQKLVRSLTTKTFGLVLEPAAGRGHLLSLNKKDKRPVLAIEYDKSLATSLTGQMDRANQTVQGGCFFGLSPQIKAPVGTIISNPPYVALTEYKSVASTALLNYLRVHNFSGKTNIAFPFMLAAAQILAPDGEMIFIVPKDFASATSAEPLRQYLRTYGQITHWVDAGEIKHFADAALETLVIWRWQKTPGQDKSLYADSVEAALSGEWQEWQAVWSGSGSILFLLDVKISALLQNGTTIGTIGDYFDILVGSVTGLDEAFAVPRALGKLTAAKYFQTKLGAARQYFETSKYKTEKSVPRAILKHLLPFKSRLQARFQNPGDAWWQWAAVRNAKVSLGPSKRARIFVLSQTRQDPFFLGTDIGFAGSMYALFPKDRSMKTSLLAEAVRILNHPIYKEIYRSGGLGVNDKFRCTPKPLAQVPLPDPLSWPSFLR